MSLNRDFSKSINYKIISKLSEKSEIIGVNFFKIAPEMTSGYLFEKMCRIKIKFSYLILSYLILSYVVLYEIYSKFFEWEQIYGA